MFRALTVIGSARMSDNEVFNAAEQAAELDDEPFRFIGMDGQEYEFPPVKTLTSRQARRFANGEEDVLAEIAPEAYEALLDVPVAVAEKLTLAWVEQGGETGKLASAPSPRKSSGKRSKRT